MLLSPSFKFVLNFEIIDPIAITQKTLQYSLLCCMPSFRRLKIQIWKGPEVAPLADRRDPRKGTLADHHVKKRVAAGLASVLNLWAWMRHVFCLLKQADEKKIITNGAKLLSGEIKNLTFLIYVKTMELHGFTSHLLDLT